MRKGAVFLVLLGLVLVGCDGSSTDPTVPTTNPPISTTTRQGPPAPFPVRVESDLGPVSIMTEPQRIVSLSATHTEMLYAIGAHPRVVATDLTSNFPTAALGTVKLDSFNFNVEEVAALQPDLVIIAFGFQGEPEALEALDIPFLLMGPPATLDGAFLQLRNLGAATGRGDEAILLAQVLEEDVRDLIAASAPIRGVTFFHEVDETLYSATSESFIGDLYSQLGLVNIADTAGVSGSFPQLSAEYIVDEDPEFVFLADANFGVSPESVAARPGWGTIRAVEEGNLVALDGDMAGRWGPRTVDLMRSIFEAVEAWVP